MAKSPSLPLETPPDAKAALNLFATFPNAKRYRLRKGATEEMLAAREEKLGHRLPDELRELLLEHDGIRETLANSGDLLGGTKTLSSLRRDVRKQWASVVEELGEDAPFRFGRRYLVIGTTNCTGHDFALLDMERQLDGDHPVLRFDFDDSEEVEGFRSLTHYLHWVLLSSNDVPFERLRKLFPERYDMQKFKRMMAAANKVERPTL